MSDSKRRVSSRSIKRKSTNGENEEVVKKKVRSCEKAGCIDVEPSCCLLSYDGCTESGYTSRWYHLSLGEHFCNNCFDNLYRPGRPGNLHYNNWINEWTGVARVSKPTIKVYVVNELLPYWIKCTNSDCGKWRIIRKPGVLDFEFIRNFKCSVSCSVPEDKLVSLASNPYFIDQLAEAPLLKSSPAEPYLKRFLSEDVGICPLSCTISTLDEIDDIEPFSLGQCGEASIWPKPDEMDDEETQFVSNTLISAATYLGIRNLIVALWNLSPKEWLDMNKVNAHFVCRGLVRIHLLSLAELVLKLLTRKSVINYGILENPGLRIPKSFESDVLIIGAGISGLAASRHLQNLGVNVTVFEASSDIGGRVKDNPLTSMAYFIQGLLNNPFRILAIQADLEYQKLKGDAIVFDFKGKPISVELEKRMQQLLRGIAQGALETALENKEDSNWYWWITDVFSKLNKTSVTQSDSQLFHHLLGLFELELGADFRSLSLLNWESAISIKGNNAFFPGGLKPILKKLAENLNIVYNNKVKRIDYSAEKVKVVSSKGEFFFSKVLVTVPLPVLREGGISFIPPLPSFKQKAFEDLADYYCAKLVMEFPKKFWCGNNQKSFREFSIVSDEQLFPLFLDVTGDKKNSTPTLVTFIPPKACDVLKNKNDKDIVDMCMKLLKKTFSEKKNVPSPSKWFLTDLEKTDFNSYGSYFKVGSGQTAFDDMAKAVDDKLFFAGEATFRNNPGSLTGAYLSGLREAAKILEHFELF